MFHSELASDSFSVFWLISPQVGGIVAHNLTVLHQHNGRGETRLQIHQNAVSRRNEFLSFLWLQREAAFLCISQFLPVYKPSEEERRNPTLYADNVQKLMAE